jgi:uncharacterized cupin superfamily protein
MTATAKDYRPGVLVRAADAAAAEEQFSHPWNPKSLIIGTRLSQVAGLERSGVSIARLPPGKESFVLHRHHFEEEWLFILTGRGMVQIDDSEHQVATGDFIGFPVPSAAHHLRNPFDEPLVYLMGGESKDFEIADFPGLDRRMIRYRERIEIYPLGSGVPFPTRPGAKEGP